MNNLSPEPWTPWFDYDEEGFITQAGVDSGPDREANVCVTTCENIVHDDKETFNATVKADTYLLAAGPKLLALLKDNLRTWDDEEDSVREEHAELIERTRSAIAELENIGGATMPQPHEPTDFEMDPDGRIRCADTGEVYGHVPIALRNLYSVAPKLLETCKDLYNALKDCRTFTVLDHPDGLAAYHKGADAMIKAHDIMAEALEGPKP